MNATESLDVCERCKMCHEDIRAYPALEVVSETSDFVRLRYVCLRAHCWEVWAAK